MSDILLATKLHIPAVHGKLVSRPRLIQKLNDGIAQNRRLTFISAPAGYGKSTLLSEWVSQVGVPVAWLSLEKAENTPTRFWSYFVAALSTIPHLRQAGIFESIHLASQSPRPLAMDGLLADLVNDLSKIERSAILVLDDLHAITERQIHQDLLFLIDHLPHSANSLHLVVASRMDPPWPLARWRARGELNELRPADLRFSPDETVQFLNQALQLSLPTQDVLALQERTEGWVAGLQMACVSMQGRLKTGGVQEVSRFIESFAGSNRFILDYLMEEVISQQPAEMRDFLQDTAILERLSAPLCAALTARQDSQAILDQVEKANLFLIPLDDERLWYRYHHLFADLLRKGLNQARSDHVSELHRRASNWYAENNLFSEAITHALAAGDIQRVNELVSGDALVIVEHTELLDVLRHFEEIPEEQICSKPWLCVAYAWVKAYVDPSGGLDRILQQAVPGLHTIENALEKQQLLSQLAAIRAYTAWIKGEADQALEYARLALEISAENDWMIRAHILNTQGLALQYIDDLPGAVDSFQAAIINGQKTGRLQETFFAYSNLAFAYFLQGRLHLAFSLCTHVLSLADETGKAFSLMPGLTHAYTTMSLVQLEWSDVQGAIASAWQGIALAEQWKQADALHFSLTYLSKALCAAGELGEAFTINQRAMQLAVNVSTWFVRLSTYNEVWLNLVKGDIPSAAHWLKEAEPLIEDELKQGGTYLVMKVSLLNAQNKYEEILAILEDVLIDLEKAGKHWTLMNVLPFQALALQGIGRDDEAVDVIGHCLALAKAEGYVRIFVDRGEPMARLLQIAARRGIESEYIAKLLAAFDIPTLSTGLVKPATFKHPSKPEPTTLVEPLTDRELQVLRLLDSPLTSEEIGRELFISVNTTRTHIRNIYAKLGVNRRGDAVRRAKELKVM